MRRAAALAFIPLLASAALVGCGSSSSSSAPADTYKSVTVSGTFNKAPKVSIPKVKANGPLYVKTLIQGTGPELTSTEGMYGNDAVYDWSGTTSKLLGSSYGSKTPSLFLGGEMIPGVEKALVGQRIGSRVLAVVPPSEGPGSAAASQEGIGANDTLVFVFDMDSTFSLTSVPGKQASNGGGTLPTVVPPASSNAAPTIKINSKASPPTTLQVKVLIKGTGPVVKNGGEIIANYNGYIWRTAQSFQSSWATLDKPYTTVIGTGSGLIPGWNTGLVGQTAGSRVLLVIPPAEGYGSKGSSAGNIKGTDTLVFVVDILATA